MADYQLRPWSQIVHLHADVEAGDTAVATVPEPGLPRTRKGLVD